ncbi:MAG: hypothetical protein B6U75_02380 [Desulfurococcales archaeon ex4484_217_1]|nr:MAG: hypothetical protein B6U75_02380 [Desulfurococcales archaeon ex4484_217_1]
MVKEVIVPRMGDVPEATVLKWLKKEGDKVNKGEPVVEVDLFKATKKLEAPVSGFLAKILVKENEVVSVGSPVALIAESAEELEKIKGKPPVVEKPKPVVKPKVEVAKPVEAPKRIKISPRARKLAEQYGIDITKIKGTGPGGRIVERDVLRYIEEMKKLEALTPRVKEVRKLIGKRRTIAWRLSEEWKAAPHINIVGKVDLSKASAFRKIINEQLGKKGVHVTFTDLFIKAAALAAVEVPEVNASLEGEEIKIYEDININIAVATPEGLVVPVIRNPHKKTFEQLAREREDIVKRAREGKLTEKDVLGGTITLSNMGMYDVVFFSAVLNPPQAVLIAIGKAENVPVVEGDTVKVKPMAYINIIADHRIIDGAVAANYLKAIKDKLENPEKLLLESEKNLLSKPIVPTEKILPITKEAKVEKAAEYNLYLRAEELEEPKKIVEEYMKAIRQYYKFDKETAQAFFRFSGAATRTHVLPEKIKHLITIAVSVATHCKECVAIHIRDALEAGATPEEIIDAVTPALLLAGGPGTTMLDIVFKSIEAFMKEKKR